LKIKAFFLNFYFNSYCLLFLQFQAAIHNHAIQSHFHPMGFSIPSSVGQFHGKHSHQWCVSAKILFLDAQAQKMDWSF
jgi:hypothetical protein